MKILPGIAALSLTLCLPSGGMGAIYLSLDRLSPSLGSSVSAADVLITGPAGLSVWRSGNDLGLNQGTLEEGDNLNALSSGRDRILAPVHFSVDLSARGREGSAVDSLTPAEETSQAAAAIFQALPPSDSNTLFLAAEQLNLMIGDDLTALSLLPFVQGVYFSIDGFSDSINEAAGVLPGNIFLNNIDTVFASWEHIGLKLEDDLNSLWLWDDLNPGTLDAGMDFALFSLGGLSPSLFDPVTGQPRHSPGDIWYTDFTGSFRLWVSAAEIGLGPFDELNALSPSADVLIPEPASLLIWSLFAAGWLVPKRWTRVAFRRP